MGAKLCWTGLTIIMAAQIIKLPAADVVGGVIMLLGCVVLWVEKSG